MKKLLCLVLALACLALVGCREEVRVSGKLERYYPSLGAAVIWCGGQERMGLVVTGETPVLGLENWPDGLEVNQKVEVLLGAAAESPWSGLDGMVNGGWYAAEEIRLLPPETPEAGVVGPGHDLWLE